MNGASSSQAFPPKLWGRLKSEFLHASREPRARTVTVEYAIDDEGQPTEARVRAHGSYHAIDLSEEPEESS